MGKKPFEEIKVLDLCWLGVGVFILNFLGHYGAKIIRVESTLRPDLLRSTPPFAQTYQKGENPGLERSGYFANTHVTKEYGISLNLRNQKGIDLLKRLVTWADVVVEGWTTDAMENLGLGYEQLKKINPDIIMVRTNGYGHTGPLRNARSTGIEIMAVSGLCDIAGWPDRPSVPITSYYTDQIAPLFAALAMIAALDYRRRTGKGQCIDHAHLESGINLLEPIVLDYTVNRRNYNRNGNKCADSAPHGVYKCKGDDRWCAIAVSTDEDWQKLCKVIGGPSWTTEKKFSTVVDRVNNSEELDVLLEQWTINYTPEEIMDLMQSTGVAAGRVSNAKDQAEDPQLKYYNFFRELDHPYLGKLNFYHPPPFTLSDAPSEVSSPVLLGQHTFDICTDILGISDTEFVQLMQEGVFE